MPGYIPRLERLRFVIFNPFFPLADRSPKSNFPFRKIIFLLPHRGGTGDAARKLGFGMGFSFKIQSPDNKNSRQWKVLWILDKTLLASMIVATLAGGIFFGLFVNEVASGHQLAMLTEYRPSTPTRLYDRNGKVFAELFRHKQELVPYRKIPPHVVQAFLSVEDDNFFHHIGIDFFGILRAALTNVRHMRVVQGGSTLTQQLAKQIYLNVEGERKRSFSQKIRETILAIEMEEELSKEDILEVYFNVIYLGHGCKGLSCAARVYFDKNVEDLSIAEGAMLARLPKSPVEFSPFKNPTETKRQHKIVLQLMADDGYIPEDRVQSIHDDFWRDYWGRVIVTPPSRNIYARRLDEAPYFTDYVRQELEKIKEVGEEALYTRGLRIYTTLDSGFQKVAEEEMSAQQRITNRSGQRYARQGKQFGVDTALFGMVNTLGLIFPVGKVDVKHMSDSTLFRKEMENQLLDGSELLSYLSPGENPQAAMERFRRDTVKFITNMEVQDAFATVEPRTGYITAMIGGTEFSPQNQFNRAIQARRQPGSAFKIFVYGAGLEQRKIGSNSALNDAPLFTIDEGETWSPGNYDEGYRGLVSATTALALSLNTCSVQTYFKTGGEPIIDFASRLMKISDRDRFTTRPSLALGSGEITPMELLTAVSIIANDGRDVIPFAVRYVTDESGNILFNEEANVRRTLSEKTANGTIQVIEPGTAFILRQMMRAVADHGTVTRGLRDSDLGGFKGDMAGKTGTTSSWSDAWVIGFNPEYATVVWFGFDKSAITMGPGQAGGSIASPVLGYFYRKIYDSVLKKAPPRFADRPDGGRPPAGVINGGCGGYAMGPVILNNELRFPPAESICASEDNRIYDQRALLMKEFGITPGELGVQGNVHFKSEQ